MSVEFKLPVLGENIASGTVSKIMVAVGDAVAIDQPVIEVETDKAVLEIPSSVAGKVLEIRVQVGKTVAVGEVVLVIEPAASGSAPQPPGPIKSATTASISPRTASPPPVASPVSVALEPPHRPTGTVLAAPSVRRLAGELGVSIEEVAGSGAHGRITAEDVRAFAQQRAAGPAPDATPALEEQPAPGTDHDRWGIVERQPMNAIRRKTALHMTNAWRNIPHVTHFDHADITSVESFRRRYARQAEARGGKLTVTAIIVKILGAALRRFPRFNAGVDMENQEIVLKKYVNIGVAVDTENGLLVPVVRDADRKSLLELSVEIPVLAEKARARRLSLDEMAGGTFTVTNLGGIGGTNFTPIINAPEVAILGMSRTRVEPVFVNGAFAPRTMLPLALSYDHRVIDGADAARFLRWVAEAIEQPLALMLEE
ncbi:MAG TPA: 2-oxo acid dehydrogenase subunit E2 [Candidatus Hydrogenedentes bacterium]|nr:2-oxo acid dehydrogenase subunit E2 [Candidatus Hydrogenedentota bacterium]HPC16920.1 2-oxo acid dehydrogenase subunit E2 [Candidatus Hydrogenedentota bacterium]HRT21564.1 2-oxo acid dehydrogenase subunit E2 [Candidatus Hydrogenedentota bacterium]HRT65158.1 2-oxo acid dehydrogenase subunit E2 [Candidatus Hydrogenedentota bacterium]